MKNWKTLIFTGFGLIGIAGLTNEALKKSQPEECKEEQSEQEIINDYFDIKEDDKAKED